MDKIVLGVFGKINSGKSTLVNSLAKEQVSIVSNVRGTTSDCVAKMTEIDGLGKVQLVDTAGYDDEGELSNQRIQKVEQTFLSSDVVIILCREECEQIDKFWLDKCKSNNKKYILCRNEIGRIKAEANGNELWLDVKNLEHITFLINKVKEFFDEAKPNIVGDLIKTGQNVLLCVPQDEGAPTGRLILPQQVVIRAILDIGACPILATNDNFEQVFENFKDNISLVITDSSEFELVSRVVGDKVNITSFSVLFAKFNGDINAFVQGANILNHLQDGDKVLIMEACSHTLSHKDIGTIKIPNMIKKYTGNKIEFDFLYGKDEPKNWGEYKLVVHCGGCTQNRQFIMSRVQKCADSNIPITNYGILIAKITGILGKIVY